MYPPLLPAKKIYRFVKTGSTQTPLFDEYHAHLQNSVFNYKKGFFNLTIDLELAWSRARKGKGVTSLAESMKRSALTRRVFSELLRLSSVYNIPITFAVVGHVALSDCSMHRTPPAFKPHWVSEDWFAVDPHSDIEHNLDYYGQDLVELILRAEPEHEIASHSFSHVDLADDATDSEIASFEISESRTVLKKRYPSLSTFVFPNNRPAFKNLLKESGFTLYRNDSNGIIQQDEFGLWQFPVGLWLSPEGLSSRDVIRLIETALQKKKLVNVWCHLYEFKNSRQLQNFFEPIFKYVSTNQQKGLLEANTMRSIVQTVALHDHG